MMMLNTDQRANSIVSFGQHPVKFISTNSVASSHHKTLEKESTAKKVLAGLSLISGESLS
jgi:hypothetical protein